MCSLPKLQVWSFNLFSSRKHQRWLTVPPFTGYSDFILEKPMEHRLLLILLNSSMLWTPGYGSASEILVSDLNSVKVKSPKVTGLSINWIWFFVGVLNRLKPIKQTIQNTSGRDYCLWFGQWSLEVLRKYAQTTKWDYLKMFRIIASLDWQVSRPDFCYVMGISAWEIYCIIRVTIQYLPC